MNARLRNRLTESEVLKIFGDVAAGLSVMHHMDPPLMHRDLKVENILLAPPPRSNPSAGPTYKLCDFGSSIPILSRRAPKSVEEVKKLEADLNMHTTLQYRAPEMVDVYQRRIIDEKADVWAMGVLLYKLCYYTTPFEENGGGPLAILNVRYRFPPTPVYSQRLKDLIASMLQEQSTARPTIDQIMLRVHNILGTTPPASVMHYVNLAASGKQVQPLPSVISSSSSKPMSGSAADAAARAMASTSITNDSGPAAGVNKDLIEIGPSEFEKRRVEQEELKKRSEGITPMRRGRPNRALNQPGSSSSSAPAGLTSPTPSRTSSPSKRSSAIAVPAQPSGHQFGFADSFSPPAVSALQIAPSRPDSGMHYSPSMPGMIPSNRASPLPPMSLSPVPPPSKPFPQHDDEASTRFPSVEQLDLQYGSGERPKVANTVPRSRTITIPTSLTSPPPVPVSSSRMTIIPGLADRKPVSAMAGSFTSTSSNGKSTPPIASAPVAGRWTGGVASNSVAKRWPHQDSAAASSREDAPSLPARKPYLHDWLPDKGQQQQRQQFDEGKSAIPLLASADAPKSASTITVQAQEDDSDSSSDDEVEKPEDVNEHVASASKMHLAMGESVVDGGREAIASKPSPVVPSSSSKVKTPDWLQQHQTETKSKDLTSSRERPLSRNGQQPVEAISSRSKIAATAPAWDEDDEEMHFLPQPDLSNNERYEQSRNKASSMQTTTTTATQTKVYADASTSPGRNTPISTSPVLDQQQGSQPTSTRPTFSAVGQATVVNERKPPSVLAPKPIRSQSTKDVDGLVSRYQDSSKGSGILPEVKKSSSLVQQRKDSLVNGIAPKPNTSTAAPPPVTGSKPSTWSSRKVDDSRADALAKPSLKPWEKEAYEKEQVHKYGSLRSASPLKDSGGHHEAQERFSGVSSLISQWQTNSTKRAPGWGHVGGSGHEEQEDGRFRSKNEDDIIKRSSTISSAAGRRPLQGRLPSREV